MISNETPFKEGSARFSRIPLNKAVKKDSTLFYSAAENSWAYIAFNWYCCESETLYEEDLLKLRIQAELITVPKVLFF